MGEASKFSHERKFIIMNNQLTLDLNNLPADSFFKNFDAEKNTKGGLAVFYHTHWQDKSEVVHQTMILAKEVGADQVNVFHGQDLDTISNQVLIVFRENLNALLPMDLIGLISAPKSRNLFIVWITSKDDERVFIRADFIYFFDNLVNKYSRFTSVPVIKDYRNGLSESQRKKKNILQSNCTVLDLSIRALNACQKMDVEKVYELVKFHKADLMKFSNVGTKTVTEVIDALKEHDLKLGMDLSVYNL